ncbi:MAG TPA: serine hydrolase domain-containing protein [Candidatus Paceibacterota bacterium]
MKNQIRQRLERAISDRVCPGAVAGVAYRDGRRETVSAGRFTYEAESPLVRDDTAYDVASITKSIPTNCLALKLVEEGRLGLDDHLTKYLPDFHNNYGDQVRIRHLLTYALIPNFPTPGFVLEKATPAEIRENMLAVDLLFPPGKKVKYSNYPALLLTMALERITGQPLDVLAAQYFFDPLGMDSSTFAPPDPSAIPPTEIDAWRGLVQGVVHDETSYVMSRERPSGCAGLFSNAPDILTFLEMLLREGELGGTRYFNPETVRQMHTNQVADAGASMGLGWELSEPRFMGAHASAATFGKTGFTGTSCVIDIARGAAFVLLSNRTYPKRGSADAINELRRDISDIVLASV